VDRVCVFASLCSGTPLVNTFGPAQDVLYQRMLQCPRQQACEQLFASDYKSTDGRGKDAGPNSRGMFADAPKLCDRIFNEGCCRDYVRTTQGRQHMLARPEMRIPAEKVQARMDELLPHKLNEIPAATIKAFPELYDGLKSVQSSPCFQQVFAGDVDHGLAVKGVGARDLSDTERFTADTYSPWIATLEAAVVGAEGANAKGCSPGDKAVLHSQVEELSNTLKKAMSSPALRGQIVPRHRNGAESIGRDYGDDDIEGRAEATAALARWIDGRKLSDVMGPSPYYDYQKALSQYHPDGKTFSCARLSLEEYGILGCYSKVAHTPAPFCPNLGY
jgi:hypothetical protein